VRALPPSTIEQYLGDGVILDPIAAQALTAMGWGGRLGVQDVHPVGDGVNELFTDDPLNGPRAGHLLPARSHIPVDQLYTFEAGCRALSRWIDVDGADRGIAAAALERPDGLRVGLLPYALRTPALVLLNVAHREQWASLFAWVAGRPLPCRVVSGVNLYPMVFFDPDDESWLLAVANLSADDVRGAELDLAGLDEGAWQVERLSETGRWQATGSLHKTRLRLDVCAFSAVICRCQRTDLRGEAGK
jgi:hypothetical protein